MGCHAVRQQLIRVPVEVCVCLSVGVLSCLDLRHNHTQKICNDNWPTVPTIHSVATLNCQTVMTYIPYKDIISEQCW